MSNRQRVSSRGLWRIFHGQSPSRLGKARLYLASRQPVELRIPASTHLLRKSSQIQGFITRMKAEPYDQIAGDYCDRFSRWVKEWQSHREARWKCGSQKLDVVPSRLATSPSPDQTGQWRREFALNPNNDAHNPSSVAHPVSDFSQTIADSDVSSATIRLTPQHVISRGCPVGLVRNAELRAHLFVEGWHSLVSSANGGYLSALRPEPKARAARPAGIAGRSGAKLMKFRPLHDRVVVRRIEGEDKTKGGIIIPDTAKEKPQEGEVIAVGPGARDESGKLVPLDVKAGDRVLFGKWSGTEVKIDGEDLLIIKESDVMGVIESTGDTKKKAA
jgi:chaperonin GroES